MNNFQQKYIKTWSAISNSYSPVIKKSRYAQIILSHLGIELSKQRRSKYVVLEIINQLKP